MPELQVEFPLTIDEAFAKYREYYEKYSHLGVVSLYCRNGEFTLTYFQ